MIAFDTNILFPFVVSDHPDHAAIGDFVQGLNGRDDVALSEFATVNLRDFAGLGFRRVFNPLA